MTIAFASTWSLPYSTNHDYLGRLLYGSRSPIPLYGFIEVSYWNRNQTDISGRYIHFDKNIYGDKARIRSILRGCETLRLVVSIHTDLTLVFYIGPRSVEPVI